MSTYYKLGSLIEGLSSTATAGGTTTLTLSSRPIQQFTGTSNQNVDLPDATTLKVGRRFDINNRSTGVLTVRDAAAGTVATIPAGTQRFFIVTDISSAAGAWRTGGVTGSGGSGVASADTLSLLSGLAGMSFSNDTIEARSIVVNPEEMGGNYWLTSSTLGAVRLEPYIFSLNGYQYAAGGANGANLSTTDRFNDDSNSFLARGALITAISGGSGTSSRTSGYQMGGFTSIVVATCQKYNDVLNSWSSITSMPTAKYENAVGYTGGYVLSTAGTIGGSSGSTSEIYDETANAWYSRQNLIQAPINNAAQFTIADEFYSTGGYDSNTNTTKTFNQKYNVSSNFWSIKTAFTGDRSGHHCFSSVGAGYVVGGRNVVPSRPTSDQAYNPDSDSWSSITLDPVTWPNAGSRGDHSHNSFGLVIGGRDNTTDIGTTRKYISSSFFYLGSLKRSTATPTSILAAVKSSALSNILPIQVRTDGDSWKSFVAGSDSVLKQGEAIATKFTSFGTITIAGGQDSTAEISSAETYNESANTWASRSSIPLARQGVAGFSTRSKGYAIGGQLSGVFQSTNYEFDDITNAWATKTAITNAVWAQGQSFSIREIGYVVSGKLSGASIYASIQSYDPVANSWSIKANPSIGRAHGYSFVLGDRGYFIGGWDATSSTFYTNSEKYEPITDSWSNLANAIPASQADGAASAINGFGYTFGGYNSGFSVLNTVRQLNPATETWATMSTMPAGRVSSPSGSRSLGGYAYATGGSNGAANVADHYRFNDLANSWSTMTSMISVRARAALANPGPYRSYEIRVGVPAFYAGLGSNVWASRASLIGGREIHHGAQLGEEYWAVCGYNGGTYLNTTEIYNPERNDWRRVGFGFAERTGPNLFSLGGKLWLSSGEASNAPTYANSSFAIDQTTLVQTSFATMSATNWSQGAGIAFNGYGYRVQGRQNVSGTGLSDCEQYNPATNAWSTKASVSQARYNNVAMVNDGEMFSIGGFNSGSNLSNADKYNDAANSWAAMTSMSVLRRAPVGGVCGGQIVISGGFNGSYLSSVESYNQYSNTWATKSNKPTANGFANVNGNFSGKVIFAGGSNALTTTEMLFDSAKQVILGMALEVK